LNEPLALTAALLSVPIKRDGALTDDLELPEIARESPLGTVLTLHVFPEATLTPNQSRQRTNGLGSKSLAAPAPLFNDRLYA
jgi:hypothetical protein